MIHWNVRILLCLLVRNGGWKGENGGGRKGGSGPSVAAGLPSKHTGLDQSNPVRPSLIIRTRSADHAHHKQAAKMSPQFPEYLKFSSKKCYTDCLHACSSHFGLFVWWIDLIKVEEESAVCNISFLIHFLRVCFNIRTSRKSIQASSYQCFT